MRYTYDIAFSFAGENRRMARRLFLEVTKKKGLRAFYDENERPQLIGKTEDEFAAIYRKRSRYVVPLISEDYKNKDWPRFEFQHALLAERERKREVILPIRLDDALMVGLRPDKGYFDARKQSAPAIARDLIARVFPSKRRVNLVTQRVIVRILTDKNVRHVAGLLATGPPARLEHLRKMMPRKDWTKALNALRRAGWLATREPMITLTPKASRSLRQSEHDVRAWREEWISTFERYAGHPDADLFRAAQYRFLGRRDEALLLLAETAQAANRESWLRLCQNVLTMVLDQDAKRVAASTRIRAMNALGICASHQRDYTTAQTLFQGLRQFATRHGDQWGVGQSLINEGVCRANTGDLKGARLLYGRATKHARLHRDHFLLARALGNFAQLLPSTERGRARAMLRESATIKRRVNDDIGLLGAKIAMGNFAAQDGNLTAAIRSFKEVVSEAAKIGAVQEELLGYRNLALAYREHAERQRSFAAYAAGARLARKTGYNQELIELLRGHAIAREEVRHHLLAATLYRELADVAAGAKRSSEVRIATFNQAVNLREAGKTREALRYFSTVLKQARAEKDIMILLRSLLAIGDLRREKNPKAALEPLKEVLRVGRKYGHEGAIRAAHDYLRLSYEKIGAYAKAAEHLQALEASATGQELVKVLYERIRMLLKAGKWRTLEKVFPDLQKRVRAAGDRRTVVDLYMLLGDAHWERKGRAKETALQAYSVALIDALREDFEPMARVGLHAFARMLAIARTDAGEFETLARKLHKWVVKQSLGVRLERFIEWPLRLARQVLERLRAGKKLTAEDCGRLLQEEFRSAGRSNAAEQG
ncbi:MAG: TIR domain-containing protein [Thermoanaerobaculia bacterium]